MRTKRALAFVMALVLSFTTFTSDLGAISVFAEPSDDSAYEEYVETATEEALAEAASDEEAVADMADETEVEGVNEEVSAEVEETVESLVTLKEENVDGLLPIEETEEAISEAEAEAVIVGEVNDATAGDLETAQIEAAKDDFFKSEYAGFEVTVSPKSAFPEGTTMFFGIIRNGVEGFSDGEYVALDINFICNGELVEPGFPVNVSVKGIELEGDTLQVYHMEDVNAEAEFVAEVPNDDVVDITADSFSIYIYRVAWDGEFYFQMQIDKNIHIWQDGKEVTGPSGERTIDFNYYRVSDSYRPVISFDVYPKDEHNYNASNVLHFYKDSDWPLILYKEENSPGPEDDKLFKVKGFEYGWNGKYGNDSKYVIYAVLENDALVKIDPKEEFDKLQWHLDKKYTDSLDFLKSSKWEYEISEDEDRIDFTVYIYPSASCLVDFASNFEDGCNNLSQITNWPLHDETSKDTSINEPITPSAFSDKGIVDGWHKYTFSVTNPSGLYFVSLKQTEADGNKLIGSTGYIQRPVAPRTYTLTFHANGGSFTGNGKEPTTPTFTINQSVNVNTPYSEYFNQVKNSFKWFGHVWNEKWYTDSECTHEVSLTDTYKSLGVTTLYAGWDNNNNITVNFDLNYQGAEAQDPKTVAFGGEYGDSLYTPSRLGYRFDGWFTQDGNEVKSDTKVTTDETHTLYAHWTDVEAPEISLSSDKIAKSLSGISKDFYADRVIFTVSANDNASEASKLIYEYKVSSELLENVESADDFSTLTADENGKYTFYADASFDGYVYVRVKDEAGNQAYVVAKGDGTVVYASVPEKGAPVSYTKFDGHLSFDVVANKNNIKKFTVDGKEYAVTPTNKDENTKTVTLNDTTGLNALSAEDHTATVYFDYFGYGEPTDNKTEFTLTVNKAVANASLSANNWVYDQYNGEISSTCVNTSEAKYYVKAQGTEEYPVEATTDFDSLIPGKYDVKVVYEADDNYAEASDEKSFEVLTPEVYFYLKKADGSYKLIEKVDAGKVDASVFNGLTINASIDSQLSVEGNKNYFEAAASDGMFKKIQDEGCNPEIKKISLIYLGDDKRAESDGHHSNDSRHFHVDFTITKATDSEATVSMEDWTYGDAQKTASVFQKVDKLGGKQQVTLEYYKGDKKLNGVPTEAGEYKVKATFAETEYYEKTTVEDTFTIGQKEITLTWKLDNKNGINRVVFDGNYHYVSAEMNGVINNDDVRLALSDDIHRNVHDYDNVTKASISGAKSGNYKLANPEFEWRINPLDLSSRSRVEIGDNTFNGNPLEPNKLDVFDTNNDWNPWNDLTLTKGTDYDVVYTNNVNASNSALATITFKGNYTGSVTKNFQIHRFNVNTQNPQFGPYVSIETISDYVYDGTEKTPELTVKFNYYNFAERKFMSELIDPKYYTLSYKDNVQVNEGNEIPTVTLVFKDWTNAQPTNFKGSLYKQFNITKAQGSIVLERNNESFTWYRSLGTIYARLVYGKDLGEYRIVENKGGGSLSYLYGSGRHEDSPYITAFNYGKNANDYVYVAPKAEAGYDTIHVISAETRNYYQAECEIDAFSENGTLDVTALDASATYDGEVHQINVSAEKNGQYKLDSDVISITYAPTKADYYWTGRGWGTRYIPDGEYTADFGYVNAGTYHIAYRVECNGYFTQEGVKTLTINKREVTPSWTVKDEWNHSVEKTTRWGDACGYTAREYVVSATLNNVVDKDRALLSVSLSNNKGTEVGQYTTKASIRGDVNNNYVLVNDSYKWEIFYHDFPANIDARGDKNAFGWYKGDITLSKRSWNPWDYTNNYLITDKSPLLPGNQPDWREALTVSKEGKNAQFKYYLQTWDGYVSPEKTFTYSLDKTAPTGEIKLGFDTLDKDLKWFVKNGASLWTTSNDENSGVASVSYSYDGWFYMPYNQFVGIPVTARKDYKNIYVKITDWAGNETVLHADEVIVYNDAEAVTTEAEYTRTTKEDVTITVNPHGNTIKNVKLFGMPLVRGIDYTVSGDNKAITLKGAYLDRLPGRMVGAMNEVQPYFFSVSYNPLGKAYNQYVEVPGFWNIFTRSYVGGYSYGDSKGADAFDTFFTINVKKATDELVITNDLSKTYDGAPVSSNDVSFNSLSDGNTVIEYKVKGADDDTYTETAPVNAGDYTVRVTKNESFNYYESSAEKDFTIAKRNVIIETLSDSKVQGSADPAFRAVVRNAIEPVSAFAWRIVGNEAPGEYEISHTIAPSEAAYPNYSFTIIHGTFTITALPVEVVTLPGPTFTPLAATPVEAEEVEEVEEVEEEEIVIEEPATPEAPEVEEEPTVEIAEEPVPETVAARCVMHWAILGLAALYAAYVVVRALQNKKELDGDEETANN